MRIKRLQSHSEQDTSVTKRKIELRPVIGVVQSEDMPNN